jgi:hypothetical protein
MKNRLFLTLFLSVLFLSKSSSQIVGNEWINYSQSYFKFRIFQQGIYRIPILHLQAAGLPTYVTGNMLQLFRDGEEVAIRVSNDGMLTASDFIEFYGERANGKLDQRLYQNTSFQLNPDQNLVSDTAYYFITFKNTNTHLHKRITQQPNPMTGLPAAELFCWNLVDIQYRNEHIAGPSAAEGQFVFPEQLNLNLSQYEKEGYVKKTGTTADSIKTTLIQPYIAAGAPNAELNSTVVGKSYANHNIKVRANGLLLADSNYSKFDFVRIKADMPMNQVNGSNEVTFLYTPSGIPDDRFGIVNLRLRYPATFNFNNSNSFYFELNPKASSYYLEISNFNYGSQAPALYDIDADRWYEGDISVGNLVRFQLPASSVSKRFILQSRENNAFKSVIALQSVQFRNYTQNSLQGDYIIITDRRYDDMGSGNGAVSAYKNYRTSVEGGNYKAIVVYTDDIYNEFGYGYEFSTLAMKNFLQYAHTSANWTAKPKHVFIIGRGLEYQNYLAYKAAPAAHYPFFAVPTFGQPGSDLLLTDFNKNDRPQISIGRLSAFNSSEIAAYLQKVKEYELQLKPGVQTQANKLWQKNILHIAGATDSLQKIPIVSALNREKTIIQSTFYGGNVGTAIKSTNDAIEKANNTLIDSFVNNGSSILHYFGHSSASTIDYGLDFPEKYSNYKKYPLVIANGCGAGNIFLFTGQKYLSERFVVTPNKGAIGFLASVNTVFTGYSGFYTDSLYNHFTKKSYGKSIGEQIKNNLNDLLSLGNFQNDFLFRMHANQIMLNGDPAIKLPSYTLPDYSIEAPFVVIKNKTINTFTDSLNIDLTFHNLGKFTSDSVLIQVKRFYPDNTENIIYHQKVPAFAHTYKMSVKTQVGNLMSVGNNSLEVTIDKNKEIVELSENNNEVKVNFTVNGSGLMPVYPQEFSIINQPNVTLKAATINLFEDMMPYVIQIDTTELFNSPLLQTHQVSSMGGLIKWQPSMVYQDSVVYYWRTGVNDGSNQWHTSSFVYLSQSSPGWNQSHYYQFLKDSFNQIKLNESDRRLAYATTGNLLQVQNVCMNGPLPNQYLWPDYLVKMNGSTIYTFGCDPYPGYSSLQFVVINPVSGKPWINTRPDPNQAVGRFGSFDPCRISYDGINYTDPFFEFSFLTPTSRKNMMNFLDSIPQGHYVMIQPRLCVGSGCGTVNNVFVDQWKSDTATLGSGVSLYHKMRNMGFNTIDSLYRNRPMIMWMEKGNPSSIKQIVGDDLGVKLYGEFDFNTFLDNGTITSTIVGPG